LYLINKKSKITKINIRGVYLSKNFLKKNKRQVMVFLRAPKHFNIGKQKIFSFKNKYTKFFNINFSSPTYAFVNYPSYFFRVFLNIFNFQFLFRINSVRVTTKTLVK
jgi:hypothetical protein